MTDTVPRHDAKFSPEVVEIFREILTSETAPVEGPIVDPFAGLGLELGNLGRTDVTGIEIEPDWAEVSPLVTQGDALDLFSYRHQPGAIATSPCYGNRFADPYLGKLCDECSGSGRDSCPTCHGEGRVHPGSICPNCEGDGNGSESTRCTECGGSGRDPEDQKRRFSYAISLGHPVHEDSLAGLHFHNGSKGYRYRHFHTRWLALIANQVLEPGPRRLILNMKDHYRTTTIDGQRAQRRQYVCDYWLYDAHRVGFRLVAALPAHTPGVGYGANMQTGKADHEMVFVFDLANVAERD